MTAPIYHTGIVQNTPAWDAIRAGKWSASKGAVIMGGLETQGLKDYVKDLAWGRVYGPPDTGFKSKAMERGHEVEPEGRDWFSLTRDVLVEQVGFVEHGRIPNFGWSPDGLYNRRRNAIEAKSPLHKAWMEVARIGLVPSEYRWQCMIACFVGQLDGLDFVTYHPLAGGLIVPCELSNGDAEHIEERITLLEPRVQAWVTVLEEKRDAA